MLRLRCLSRAAQPAHRHRLPSTATVTVPARPSIRCRRLVNLSIRSPGRSFPSCFSRPRRIIRLFLFLAMLSPHRRKPAAASWPSHSSGLANIVMPSISSSGQIPTCRQPDLGCEAVLHPTDPRALLATGCRGIAPTSPPNTQRLRQMSEEIRSPCMLSLPPRLRPPWPCTPPP